jgi:WD40 repeat protein
VVKVWDVQLSRPIAYGGHSWWVTGAAFRSDGSLVATESDNWLIKLGDGRTAKELKDLREEIKVKTKHWDPKTGDEVQPPPDADPTFEPYYSRWAGWPDAAFPTAIQVTSPDRRLIAKVDRKDARNDVQVTDAVTGRVEFTLVGHTQDVACIAFSPDGRRIATASHDRTVKLWDAQTGMEVLTLRGHTASALCVAFSPDGYRLVSGSTDHTAQIWDARPLEAGGPSADSSAH